MCGPGIENGMLWPAQEPFGFVANQQRCTTLPKNSESIQIKRNGRLVCTIPADLDNDDKRTVCKVLHLEDEVVFRKEVTNDKE